MPLRLRLFCCVAGLAVLGAMPATVTTQQSASPNGGPSTAKVDFVRDVQPIFRQSCYGCHGPRIHQNGFRLDRRADAMHGGTVVVIGPGNSDGSRLYQKLIGDSFGQQMPPTGALPPEQIAIIKAWIDQGAEWPDAAANEAPPRPTTPLMKAALAGSIGDVRRLLDAGADPNVANDSGATALMWAIRRLDITRLLLDRGADVNAVSDFNRTPLMMAAGEHDALPVVSLLVDRGANVNAKASDIFGTTTPLVEAAKAGNADVVDLLIAHGADVNAGGPAAIGLALRVGCMRCVDALIPTTSPRVIAVAAAAGVPPAGPALAVPLLLARGADPSITSPDGYTLLMLASASGAMPVDAVRALLAKGADVNAAVRGETALSLARRHGHTAVVDLLMQAGAQDGGNGTDGVAPPTPSPAASPRAAVERALPLLQQTDVTFLKKSGCVSCHNNSLTAMAVAAARAHGVRVDEAAARTAGDVVARYVESWRDRALQGASIPGQVDTISYLLLGLAAHTHAPDEATAAQVRIILREQDADGHWRVFAHRPPIESNDIEVTAAAMRTLQIYAAKNDAKAQRGIKAAAAWLAKAEPQETEERAFQLLGLGWSKANPAAMHSAAKGLLATQRPDGGWAQVPTLESDAYATGQALFALAESGAIRTTDPAFARGVKYLLSTQLADGSWLVRRRAMPLQPYFESGFPHGRDQFISAAATNWATMALSFAIRPRT